MGQSTVSWAVARHSQKVTERSGHPAGDKPAAAEGAPTRTARSLELGGVTFAMADGAGAHASAPGTPD